MHVYWQIAYETFLFKHMYQICMNSVSHPLLLELKAQVIFSDHLQSVNLSVCKLFAFSSTPKPLEEWPLIHIQCNVLG